MVFFNRIDALLAELKKAICIQRTGFAFLSKKRKDKEKKMDLEKLEHRRNFRLIF